MDLVGQEIARFRAISKWSPKIGDFVVHHGWFWNRWYGIISDVRPNEISIITEGLPVLLFSLTSDQYDGKKKTVGIGVIRRSVGGAYAVLQDGVWFIDG